MGYYTKFEFNIVLRKDVPEQLILFLGNQIESALFSRPEPVPERPFFYTPKWEQLFHRFEGLNEPYIKSENGYWKLYLTGEINYGYEEIKEFAKWISPFVAGRKKKQYIGYWKGECMSARVNFYANRI